MIKLKLRSLVCCQLQLSRTELSFGLNPSQAILADGNGLWNHDFLICLGNPKSGFSENTCLSNKQNTFSDEMVKFFVFGYLDS